ncbi:MAG: DNA methyltransferase [Cytophagales bacterium]|nr:DNA methyltransferase [Cytophagales bacterium]
MFYKDGRGATLVVESLVGKGVFNFPKDIEVISNLITLCTEEDDIILDFFAGSGSTAHAVYDLNAESKSNRNFICVQMPEQTHQESAAHKLGFKNIAQISRARIRKASEKIKKEKNIKELDFGFRYVSLTSSSFKQWSNFSGTSIEELQSELGLFNQEPLVSTWSPLRLLSELILIEGFTLSSRIEILDRVKSNKVLKVNDRFCEHSLLVCLDKEIKVDTIKLIELTGNDIFICLDSAISNVDKLRLSDKGLIKTI